MGSGLPTKVGEKEEGGVIEAFLILLMTELDLAVATGRIGTNQFVVDAQAAGTANRAVYWRKGW